MKSVLLISHGSRSPKTKKEVSKLVNTLRKKSEIMILEYAFLEIESPLIPQGIETCVKKGADEVIVLLNFLNPGRHVDVDIPRIIARAQKQYPKVKFHITKPVGQHEAIVNLFLEMIS